MPRIYKKNCDWCGAYYQSAAKNFCSTGCYGEYRVGKKRPGISRPIGDKRKHAQSGYIFIKTEKGWVQEHRLIMEQRIGRELRPDEAVHHIDGDIENNSDNNLALMTNGGHTRLHRIGSKMSGVTKEKIRQKATGRTGYVTSDETKKLISQRAKERWSKWKEEGNHGGFQ